jgi:hypothetical protein
MVPLLITIFYFTPEFIFLVPVKIAALFKRIFQSHTGTMKPDLDVVHRQAKDVCYLGICKTLNVLEDQGFSVFLRKTVNETANSRVHLFTYGNVLKGFGSRRGSIKKTG